MSINIPTSVDEILPGDDRIQHGEAAANHQKRQRSPEMSQGAVWEYKTW